MTVFRPCIDLHAGKVKQIVGATLSPSGPEERDGNLKTNFVSTYPPAYYAALYRKHNLRGGHIIMLGPGNTQAAREALEEWPDAFHVGGGITAENCLEWIDGGAEKVIVTSCLFEGSTFSINKLREISEKVGKERLVVDLSCKRVGDHWIVAMNKWQTLTNLELSKETFELLSTYCSEFLIHAADVEGKCEGIDVELVKAIADWCPSHMAKGSTSNVSNQSGIALTYAGGGKSIEDLKLVEETSKGRIDLTFGSALDIFGGRLVKFQDCVEWNKNRQQ